MQDETGTKDGEQAGIKSRIVHLNPESHLVTQVKANTLHQLTVRAATVVLQQHGSDEQRRRNAAAAEVWVVEGRVVLVDNPFVAVFAQQGEERILVHQAAALHLGVFES